MIHGGEFAGQCAAGAVEVVTNAAVAGPAVFAASRDRLHPGHATAGAAIWGGICNLPALRAALGVSADTSDEAVVLRAWQRWGPRFVAQLEGTFALAVWDGGSGALYRDPSGLRSLYVRVRFDGGRPRIAFATRPLDVPDSVPAAPRISRAGLHEYLRLGDLAAPASIVHGVEQLVPGHLLYWGVDGQLIRVEPSPSGSACIDAPGDFADAVEALDQCLTASVALRLQGALRPAAFLSGGVDSALLCAIAARTRPDTTAVTVGFDAPGFDESPLASRIASHLGLRHEVLRFTHRDYLAAFERLSQTLEQPMADPATPATVLAFERCRERFDVVLDGTGADEAVGAMPPRHIRLAVQYGSLVPRPLRAALVRLMRALPGVAGYTPLLDFEHPADTMIRWRGFTRREIEELCGEQVSFEDTTFYRTFARFPRRAHDERYSALLNAMPCDRLSQALRCTGLQVRFPFLDHATDRFIRRLPADWRYLPGEPKRILRALLERYVPRPIWDVPKHGFDFPLQWFLAADDYALVRRHLLAGRWLDRGVLDADGVRDYARRFIAGDQRLMFRVWALVVLGAWLERHENVSMA